MVQLARSSSRPRSSSGNNRETVELCVVGPKSIIPKTVTVETYLSNTWLNFFNDELELDVPLNQGIFICNTQYCPSAPREGEGWKCHLNEPIRNYINHFERRRNRYTVRICRPSDFTNNRASGASRTSRARSSTPGPNGRGTRSRSTPGNRSQRSRSVARSPFPDLWQPSILIATSSTNARSAVVTPTTQQSPYGTRQKRLHDQSCSQLVTPAEIPAKRQRRKQIIVPRLAEPVPVQAPATGPADIKQELSQTEDEVPQINDVRSVKVELPPVTSITEQFYDEDDELETDVSSGAGDSGSDANGLEGREEQGQLEEEDEGHGHEEEEENGGDQFVGSSDTSGEEDGATWEGNDEGEGEDEEEDDEDDGMSMCTAVTQEEIQLRREGIQVEDVKSVANGRMNNFSNAYMLRMKNEIKKLRKNNHWIKNVERAPLACYFLQELLKE